MYFDLGALQRLQTLFGGADDLGTCMCLGLGTQGPYLCMRDCALPESYLYADEG